MQVVRRSPRAGEGGREGGAAGEKEREWWTGNGRERGGRARAGGSGRCKAKDVISLEAEKWMPDVAISGHEFNDNNPLRALPLTSLPSDITLSREANQEHMRLGREIMR